MNVSLPYRGTAGGGGGGGLWPELEVHVGREEHEDIIYTIKRELSVIFMSTCDYLAALI
jgi:hypothetical protein